MRYLKPVIISLAISSALLTVGCGGSSKATSNTAKIYPLECSDCEYVEDSGSRAVTGSLWNGSKKAQRIVMDIEEKDATGRIVNSTYNLSLWSRYLIESHYQIPFSQGLDRRASITQITFYFREEGQNETKATPDQMLSPAYTLQLHTLPVPEGVTVSPPEP